MKEIMARFVALRDEKDALETRVKQINHELDGYEEMDGSFAVGVIARLRDAMVDLGVRNFKLGDGRMIYLHRFITLSKASGVSRESAIDALRALGLDDFVEPSYSASRVAAWFREHVKTIEDERGPMDSADAIPAEFVGVFQSFEEYQPRLRR